MRPATRGITVRGAVTTVDSPDRPGRPYAAAEGTDDASFKAKSDACSRDGPAPMEAAGADRRVESACRPSDDTAADAGNTAAAAMRSRSISTPSGAHLPPIVAEGADARVDNACFPRAEGGGGARSAARVAASSLAASAAGRAGSTTTRLLFPTGRRINAPPEGRPMVDAARGAGRRWPTCSGEYVDGPGCPGARARARSVTSLFRCQSNADTRSPRRLASAIAVTMAACSSTSVAVHAKSPSPRRAARPEASDRRPDLASAPAPVRRIQADGVTAAAAKHAPGGRLVALRQGSWCSAASGA